MIDIEMPPKVKKPLFPLQAWVDTANDTFDAKRFRNARAHEVYCVFARQCEKQFAITNACLCKEIDAATIPDNHFCFDLPFEFGSSRPITLDNGNSVAPTGKIDSQMTTNFPCSHDDYIHIIMLLALSPS